MGPCCRYQLFNHRQINGAPHEWERKLPDFVKRLEDALYRAADSKVGPPPWAARAPRGSPAHGAAPQEAYLNSGTLEARLQDVARDMVNSQQHQRRWVAKAGQQPGQAGGEGALGHQQPAPGPGSAQPGGSPFGGPQGQTQPGSGPGQPSAAYSGLAGSGGQAPFPITGLKAEPPAAGPLGGLKAEPGAPQGPAGGSGAPTPAVPQASPSSIGLPSQPMMSNGAPVLLREPRGWTPGPPNVRPQGPWADRRWGTRARFPATDGRAAVQGIPGQAHPHTHYQAAGVAWGQSPSPGAAPAADAPACGLRLTRWCLRRACAWPAAGHAGRRQRPLGQPAARPAGHAHAGLPGAEGAPPLPAAAAAAGGPAACRGSAACRAQGHTHSGQLPNGMMPNPASPMVPLGGSQASLPGELCPARQRRAQAVLARRLTGTRIRAGMLGGASPYPGGLPQQPYLSNHGQGACPAAQDAASCCSIAWRSCRAHPWPRYGVTVRSQLVMSA